MCEAAFSCFAEETPQSSAHRQTGSEYTWMIKSYIFEPIGLTQFIVFMSKCNSGKECDFSAA